MNWYVNAVRSAVLHRSTKRPRLMRKDRLVRVVSRLVADGHR